jgi:hypothetical protein
LTEKRKKIQKHHLRLIDNGTVTVGGIPLIVIPGSERRLGGRIDGNGPFF